MARPLLPIDQLKNPRHLRRSTTVAAILPDAPKPSKATLAMWKPMVDMCITSILSQPSRENNKAKKNRVQIRFTSSWVAPKGFPVGKVVERGVFYVVRRYNPEDILRFCYMHRYTTDSPAMLYEKRSKHINNMTRLENSAEIDVDKMFLQIYYDDIDSILNYTLGEWNEYLAARL